MKKFILTTLICLLTGHVHADYMGSEDGPAKATTLVGLTATALATAGTYESGIQDKKTAKNELRELFLRPYPLEDHEIRRLVNNDLTLHFPEGDTLKPNIPESLKAFDEDRLKFIKVATNYSDIRSAQRLFETNPDRYHRLVKEFGVAHLKKATTKKTLARARRGHIKTRAASGVFLIGLVATVLAQDKVRELHQYNDVIEYQTVEVTE